MIRVLLFSLFYFSFLNYAIGVETGAGGNKQCSRGFKNSERYDFWQTVEKINEYNQSTNQKIESGNAYDRILRPTDSRFVSVQTLKKYFDKEAGALFRQILLGQIKLDTGSTREVEAEAESTYYNLWQTGEKINEYNQSADQKIKSGNAYNRILRPTDPRFASVQTLKKYFEREAGTLFRQILLGQIKLDIGSTKEAETKEAEVQKTAAKEAEAQKEVQAETGKAEAQEAKPATTEVQAEAQKEAQAETGKAEVKAEAQEAKPVTTEVQAEAQKEAQAETGKAEAQKEAQAEAQEAKPATSSTEAQEIRDNSSQWSFEEVPNAIFQHNETASKNRQIRRRMYRNKYKRLQSSDSRFPDLAVLEREYRERNNGSIRGFVDYLFSGKQTPQAQSPAEKPKDSVQDPTPAKETAEVNTSVDADTQAQKAVDPQAQDTAQAPAKEAAQVRDSEQIAQSPVKRTWATALFDFLLGREPSSGETTRPITAPQVTPVEGKPAESAAPAGTVFIKNKLLDPAEGKPAGSETAAEIPVQAPTSKSPPAIRATEPQQPEAPAPKAASAVRATVPESQQTDAPAPKSPPSVRATVPEPQQTDAPAPKAASAVRATVPEPQQTEAPAPKSPPSVRATVSEPQQTDARAALSHKSGSRQQVGRFTAEDLHNISPRVIRNIQTQLSPEQVSWLKPEQVRNLRIANLTEAQVQAFTELQIAVIPPKKIKSIQSKLSPEQVPWLKPEQVANLNIANLTEARVQAFTEIQITVIPPNRIKDIQDKFSPEQIPWLRAEQFRRLNIADLTEAQVQAFTEMQIPIILPKQINSIQRHLLPEQVYWLSNEQVRELNIEQMTVSQLHHLVKTKTQVQSIPETDVRSIQDKLLPEQVAWLSEKQLEQINLSSFNTEQIQALTSEQLSWNSLLNALPAKQVQNLAVHQFQSIAVHKLHLVQAKFSVEQIAKIPKALEHLSVELLTREQIEGMSIKALQKMDVSKLSVEQWGYVSSKKIHSLTKKDLEALDIAQLHVIQEHLLPRQIVNLKEEHLANLNIPILTVDQVKALSKKDLIRVPQHLFSSRQLVQLTDDTIAEIPVNELNKFNTTQLKTIQVRLTSSQLNGLKKKLFETLSFESLTLEQIEGLKLQYLLIAQGKINSELIPSIERLASDFNVRLMTVAQTQAMSVEQLQSVLNTMSGRRIQVLTHGQVSGLLGESVELSSKKLRHLRRNLLIHQVSRLSEEQKERLGFRGFSVVDQLRQITASEADSLTPTAVSRLVRSAPEMVHVLSAEQLNNLNRLQLRRIQRLLLPAQIASLANARLLDMQHLSIAQIQGFTPEQINLLSKEQIRMIQIHLSPKQIASVNTSTVLNKLDLQALSQPQVEALTFSQPQAEEASAAE